MLIEVSSKLLKLTGIVKPKDGYKFRDDKAEAPQKALKSIEEKI